MDPQLSSAAFDHFFFWAPIAIGLVIYFTLYLAKRHETASDGVPIAQSYVCAGCGRREAREHMVPQEHGGRVSWYCTRCAHA